MKNKKEQKTIIECYSCNSEIRKDKIAFCHICGNFICSDCTFWESVITDVENEKLCPDCSFYHYYEDNCSEAAVCDDCFNDLEYGTTQTIEKCEKCSGSYCSDCYGLHTCPGNNEIEKKKDVNKIQLIKNNLLYEIVREASEKKLFQKGLSTKLKKKIKPVLNLNNEEMIMFCAILKTYVEKDGEKFKVNLIKKFYKIQNRSWIRKLNIIKQLVNKGFVINNFIYEDNNDPYNFEVIINNIIYRQILLGKYKYEFDKNDNRELYKYIQLLFNLCSKNKITFSGLKKEINKIQVKLDLDHYILKLSINMDDDELIFFYYILSRFLSNVSKISSIEMKACFNNDNFIRRLLLDLSENKLYLQKKKIIEYKFDKIFDISEVIIDKVEINNMISGIETEIVRDTGILKIRVPGLNNMNMIFSKELGIEINRIKSSLNNDRFMKIRQKMKNDGFSEAMTFLLYGPSGTGKSMSVYEIARETGREIFEVDMAVVNGGGLVGDLERETKKIFTDYRSLCSKYPIMPILLINEADSLLSKRVSIRGNNDQTRNMQVNIILDELDKFKGILFVTTNLQSDFDKAMDRRFLQKIKFQMPDQKMRSTIWNQKLPDLDEADCNSLSKFSISGGIIENIARKCKIQSNLELKEPDLNEIMDMARKEVGFRGDNDRNVGFVPKIHVM